ncbi:hypothetical protein GOP47_0027861 [Adiantum capillus-veneris]|nr:hypothetical protein GOP47_0027861 [Adiantum capillus-veneris]
MLTVLRMRGDEAKLQTLPLVLRGKAKVWFDGLEEVHKQDWIGFRERFLQRYRKVVSASEADAKIKGLQQDVSVNFDAFVDKFEAYWGDLAAATQETNAGYLKLERFLSCLHPYVRERVDYEDPRTYDEAVRVARAKSQKMKKKMEAGLLQLAITTATRPKPKQIEEHQKIKAHFLDMHLIKAHEANARLEEVEEVPTRAQKVQRGIFRVPHSLLAQESEVVKDLKEEVAVLEPATRLTAMVQELTSAKEESDSSQSSSSVLDTDSMLETEFRSSRYETYDVFHVDEVENNVCEWPASQLNIEEQYSVTPSVNLPVEQPSLVSCDGESLLEEEVWFDGVLDLIEEQVFEDDLQEIEAEVEVCSVHLSMQGVGQPCLGEHVEVHGEVSRFVCVCGELAPADDSMEADTGATYEREAPCNEEGVANLAGDEVFDEQVEALAGHVLEYEELALEPFTEGWVTGMQGRYVCLAMEQVEANGRVLLFYVILWIHVLWEFDLQVSLCQWQGFFTEDYTLEGSLAGDMIAAYGTNASSGRKHVYGWHEGFWMQGDEAPCYKELKGWPVYIWAYIQVQRKI